MKNYKEAWLELKNRLENVLWDMENSKVDEQRIKDIKHTLKKMKDFEDKIKQRTIPIYQKNGSVKHLNKNEIKINSENAYRLENYNTGVNIHFTDGSVKFINNASTDGVSVEFSR